MKGILLVNLGTPEAPTPSAVGTYLTEFLSDPRVVDLPRWLWLPVLRLAIIPLRRNRSAEAYSKIWTPEGSPLLVYSQKLADKLQQSLGDAAPVRLAMRYGQPDVISGLMSLRDSGVTRLQVLPMYPQYSGTTTETVFDAVEAGLKNLAWFPQVTSIQKYHDNPAWISAVADSISGFQELNGKPEKLIFSLHGIPQRYVANGDPYSEQCEQSVSDITSRLGLHRDEWMLTYQSRVGREPWLQPYTDISLKELALGGTRYVQVVCPGFAVDCLETLEEIAMMNAELFIEHGGERLDYIPALNDSDPHVEAMSGLLGD